MIRNDFNDTSKRIMVALVGAEIAGQALYSVKTDTEGKTYGFCFSRYVAPAFRRRGIGALLLEDALGWFASQKAEYALAQTHVTNVALQRLFTKFGFTTSGPFTDPWEYYTLRKEL
jgi:ribosomal protein S18 acetylase RimI-like enzyme